MSRICLLVTEAFRTEACFIVIFSATNSTRNAVESIPDFLDEDELKTNLIVYEIIHYTTIT
jgi:flavodoxin